MFYFYGETEKTETKKKKKGSSEKTRKGVNPDYGAAQTVVQLDPLNCKQLLNCSIL